MARHEGPDLTAFKNMGYIRLKQPTRLPCGHRSWVSTEDGKMCVECDIREQWRAKRIYKPQRNK